MTKWKISYNLLFFLILLVTFIFVLLGPLAPAWLIPPLGIILLVILKLKDRMKLFTFVDFSLILFYTFMFVITLLGLQLFSILVIPFWKLLIAGICADIIAFLSGWIPILGDFIGGIIIFFIVWFITGSLILSGVAMMLAFIPGPIPLVFIMFLIIRILGGILL